MSNSDALYAIYRQAVELKKSLEVYECNKSAKVAIELADRLKDAIFNCVGIAAAHEIDERYWKEKSNPK